MKLLFSTAVLLFFIGCTSSPTAEQVSNIDADDEETLRNLKTTLWEKAYSDQDTLLLNQILHEDFQLVDDNGDTYSKKDEMEYISNYGPSYSDFEFKVDRVTLFDNGTATLFGTGTMKGINDDGSAYVTTYKSSDLFIKVGEEWKAVHSHVSGVKEDVYPAAPKE